jgi:transcriptional regulator with GAF, ATPase, and Fis domain
MSAMAAEEGGADLIMVLSAGYYRMHGISSAAAMMPYANANDLTWEICSKHVLPRVRKTPVFMGICAQDPGLDLEQRLEEARRQGLAGVTNFPTTGFYDPELRRSLDEDGLGIVREIEMLQAARERGLLTIGFCLSDADAFALARSGVDILCMNLGPAEGRLQEPTERQAALDRAIASIRSMLGAARGADPKTYGVVFGGPVVLPQDTAQMYQRTDALGYIGGSAVERFPTQAAIVQTVREFKHVTRSGRGMDRLGALVGASPSMRQLFETIRSVAPSDATILVTGESGTGKELAAREIHRLSPLHDRPLVGWNCAAMTETLAMSELFGHEKGAFTGAVRTHVGKFELAEGGTLFMDEVADLPLAVQASLLRVLEEREIVRVGGEEGIAVDVRLIAATNRDFRELIPAGRFRMDLYYRLSTVVLRMPPLRERQEDLPFLVWELCQEFSQKYGQALARLPDPVMSILMDHPWPGNVRELRNVVERIFLLGKGRTLSRAWFEELFAAERAMGGRLSATGPLSASDLADRRRRLHEALTRNAGNKTAAARELGVTRKTVHQWLRERR